VRYLPKDIKDSNDTKDEEAGLGRFFFVVVVLVVL